MCTRKPIAKNSFRLLCKSANKKTLYLPQGQVQSLKSTIQFISAADYSQRAYIPIPETFAYALSQSNMPSPTIWP